MVKVALLGTRRQQPVLEAGDSPLQQVLARLPADNAEHQLLSAAGSTYIYMQIGAGPLRYPREHPGPPLSPDPRSPCGPAITNLLFIMVGKSHHNHLPEFLAAIQRAGLRLPSTLVPNMLALGFRMPALRPLIIPLLSPANRHLAAGHPEWLFAGPAIESWSGARAIWQDLSPVSKMRFTQQLRTTHPELARQLVESTWKAEIDSSRTNLLKALELGLDTADEPFLEMALDDRSQAVRRRAAELLAFLPNSRLGLRMSRYAVQFLRWEAGQIIVRFPAVTPEMVRDGVYGLQHKSLPQVRSRQLIQMVGAVPLDFWTAEWPADPQTIVHAALATNWARTLTTAFAEAAHHQKNLSWAKAILWARGPDLLIPKLVDVLDTAGYTQWLDYARAQGHGRPDLNFTGPLFKSIRYRHDLDDLALAQTVLQIIAGFLAEEPATGKVNINAQRVFSASAYRLPAAILPEAEALLGDPLQIAPLWQRTAAELINTLRFRQHMIEAVASGGWQVKNQELIHINEKK